MRGGGVGASPTRARLRTTGWYGTSWWFVYVLSGAPGSRCGRSAARPGLVPLPLSGLGATCLWRLASGPGAWIGRSNRVGASDGLLGKYA
jgi:hypothetical protein